MQLTARTLDPITRAADPASTLLAFTGAARVEYPGARRVALTYAEQKLVRRLRLRAALYVPEGAVNRYHTMHGAGWHLTLSPRAAGAHVYLSRASALRVYQPVASIDQPTDATHEPSTLCAQWLGSPGALVFRRVSPQDAPLLAHYTTASVLVYRDADAALTGTLACFAAVPGHVEANA